MGESYLERKLFSRLRRVRTQSSVSPTNAQVAYLTSESPPFEPSTNTTSPSRVHSSVSNPQLGNLMLLRARDSQDSSGAGSSAAVSGLADPQTRPMSTTMTTTTDDNDDDDDDQIRTSSSGTEQQQQQDETKKKLKATSRAIVFFRRAASTLTSSHSSHQLHHHNNNRKLTGCNTTRVLRQSTADSSLSQQSSSGGQWPIGVNNEVPQFIVPKMNALKLPLVCLIKSLEGELMREVFVHRYEIGQYLIESLKVSLGVNDCKYFGLKMAKSVDDQEDLRNVWLDLNESVCKQINKMSAGSNTTTTTGAHQRSIEFYLRIKFYPPNLGRVQDVFLRNYLWLQLRRDLRLGKLTSSMNNLSFLMACVLQHELGDHKPSLQEHLPELNIMPNQDVIEESAVELWRTRLIGLKRHQAQMQFLRAAVILETYGFDYYPVRDHQRQRAYLLGFNYAGIKTIRNGRIVHHFRWHSLSKISYERRMIIFHIYPTENSKRKQILGFKCLTQDDCQNLYMRLLEQKYFFTVDLAYFDKSIRRPSCLYTSQTSEFDWMANGDNGSSSVAAGQHQLQPPFGMTTESNAPNESSYSRAIGQSRSNSYLVEQSDFAAEPNLDSSNNSSPTQDCAGCESCGRANFKIPLPTDSVIGKSTSMQENSIGSGCYGGFEGAESSCLAGTLAEDNTLYAVGDDQRPSSTQNSTMQPPPTNKLQRQQSMMQYNPHNRNSIATGDQGWSTNYNEPANANQSSQYRNQTVDLNRTEQGGQEDSVIWTKIVSFIESCRRPTGAIGLRQRLVQIAESVLVQPVVISQYQEAQQSESSNVKLVPALRFCLGFLAVVFVLRLTDNLSKTIIELITLSPRAAP